MEPVFKNLGKVRPTVDNNNWSIDNEYDLLTIVYDPSSNKSYISRQPVPTNVVIDNREYWLPFGVGKFVDNAIININYLDGVSEELVTYTLEEAIARIGDEDKRLGIIISFYGNESNDSHTPGWCLYQFISSDLNDWDNVDAWNSIYYNRNKNVGWFRTESELLSIYPNPHKGDYCYIGTSLLGSFVYRCYENGTWVNTNELASANIGVIIDGTITISQNGTWIVDGEDTGIKAVGTGIDRITYTASSADGGTNILQIKLTDGTQFSFPIKNGNQGNSGYQGAAEELEVVNNLTDGGATKALSAEMGKQLKSLINEGYFWVGIADLNTVAGSFNGKVFYIATTPGIYDISFGSIELADNEVAFLKYNGSWSKQTIDLATKTQVNQLGQYIENLEWAKVVTDNEGKILYGVKTDGNFYFGVNCPPQIQDYVQQQINEYKVNIDELFTTKVDKVIGKSLIDADFASSQSAIENQEWLNVIIDNEGKVLGGRDKDGRVKEFVGLDVPDINTEKVTSNNIDTKIAEINDHLILSSNAKDQLRNDIGFVIENPYPNITSKVRHRAISHEHVTNQAHLEQMINDGIDILCVSNYSPGVPAMPIDGYSRDYEDWEFIKDEQGNIIYEKDYEGNVREKFFYGSYYKIPKLRRRIRTQTGGFSDFIKADDTLSDLANMVQLPNAEHTHWQIAKTYSSGALHINFIGSNWGNAVNSDLLEDVTKYNQDNDYNLTNTTFKDLFPLWDLQQVLYHVQYEAMITNKVFGTINHPGWTYIKDFQVDRLMAAAPKLFKGMEIYNHSDTEQWMVDLNIYAYDRALMRGYKLWCLAVNDWGAEPNNPLGRTGRCGCNLMYLPADYETTSMNGKQNRVLDAYMNGSFAAVGFGSLDISNVTINGRDIYITFNQIPDSTIIDIDGVRTSGGANQTLHATVDINNTFIRFEAYIDGDFIFTQPFYIKKN